ncbi:MAG TPA: cupin domain-containing protein, partial [Dinghuibacter sp.]|uniref:cupin domain-containing protein n=1 Tax=Dinghuibacter sp. TaxID=2024697 RepID=UPI002CE181D7
MIRILILSLLASAAHAQDTLTARVTHTVNGALPPVMGRVAPDTYIQYGSATLVPGTNSIGGADWDELLFIKKGIATIANGKRLGPGGVYLIQAGSGAGIANDGQESLELDYIHIRTTDRNGQAGHDTSLNWADLPVKTTAKGETRQILTSTSAHFQKIDLHATTLNPGETSHPPHVHPEAEIILVREGDVEELIDGKPYPAKGGDLVLLTPGSPHNIRNTGTTPAVYYALQWR